MEQRTTVGIDLAKEVFAVCVLNAAGEIMQRQRLRRVAFERWLAALPNPCIVAMEACSSAHHWGRLLAARGHSVRLIAPAFVAPFRKSGKNDDHDAEAIAIAASQPTMRFVAVKSVDAHGEGPASPQSARKVHPRPETAEKFGGNFGGKATPPKPVAPNTCTTSIAKTGINATTWLQDILHSRRSQTGGQQGLVCFVIVPIEQPAT